MNWPCFSVVINKLVQLFGLVTLKILIATLLTGSKTFFLMLGRIWRWIIKYPCLKLFSIFITYNTCILTLSTPKSDQNLISCYSIDQYNIKLPSDVNEKKNINKENSIWSDDKFSEQTLWEKYERQYGEFSLSYWEWESYLLEKLYLGHSWSERVNDLDAIYFNYNSCLMKGDTDDNESCRSSFSGDSSFFLHGSTFKKGTIKSR